MCCVQNSGGIVGGGGTINSNSIQYTSLFIFFLSYDMEFFINKTQKLPIVRILS